MPDQYSGTIRSSAGSTHAYRWRTLSVDRFPSLQEEIDALRHSGQLAQTPAFTNYMNDLVFVSPTTSRPPARCFLIATSAPLMIINLRFADRHIPVFMPPNYPFHGLTAPCSWRDPPDHHPGFRSPRGPGRLPFFHETGSRSGRTGAIRPQQHLLC